MAKIVIPNYIIDNVHYLCELHDIKVIKDDRYLGLYRESGNNKRQILIHSGLYATSVLLHEFYHAIDFLLTPLTTDLFFLSTRQRTLIIIEREFVADTCCILLLGKLGMDTKIFESRIRGLESRRRTRLRVGRIKEIMDASNLHIQDLRLHTGGKVTQTL